MKKETLYIDTSVPSAYFDGKVKERQEATIRFWVDILPNYQVYLSEITVEELENTKDKILRRKLKKLTEGFSVLKVNKKTRDLAMVYVEKKVFPERLY